MKNRVIVLFVGGCLIIGFNCKVTSANEFTISQNIDTSELKYEKVFPQAFRNYLDSEVGYHGKKADIKDEERNSIAIIYFYKNDTLIRDNTIFGDNRFLSAFCSASFRNDTLGINARRAFFEAGDLGVVIQISGNYFSGNYYENGDGSDNLKYMQLNPVMQTLALDKGTAYEYGKILTGQYEGTFRMPPDNYKNTDTTLLRIKVVFRCVEKQLLEL